MKKKITFAIMVLFGWAMLANAQPAKRSDKLHFELDSLKTSVITYQDLSKGDTVMYVKLKKIAIPKKLTESFGDIQNLEIYLNSGSDSFIVDNEHLKESIVKNKHGLFVFPMTVSNDKENGFYFSEKSMSFKPFNKVSVYVKGKNDNIFSAGDFLIALILSVVMILISHLGFSGLTMVFKSLIIRHITMSIVGLSVLHMLVSAVSGLFFNLDLLVFLAVPGGLALIVSYFIARHFYKHAQKDKELRPV